MLSEKNTYGVLKKYCGRVEIRIKSLFLALVKKYLQGFAKNTIVRVEIRIKAV